MDIVAHAMWAGLGTQAVARRYRLRQRTVLATVALAVLPDLLQLLPIAAWALAGDGSIAALWAYVVATPGEEPRLPASIGIASYHLHCVMHSAVIAGAFTALLWMRTRSLWFPLLGWWSHIVIDVFTHSQDYYPSPVLYPITMQGFDGVAWNQPWFIAVNYGALILGWLWLFHRRRRLD